MLSNKALLIIMTACTLAGCGGGGSDEASVTTGGSNGGSTGGNGTGGQQDPVQGDVSIGIASRTVTVDSFLNTAVDLSFKEITGGALSTTSVDNVTEGGDVSSSGTSTSVTVSGFRISTYEITQGQWTALVSASGASVSSQPWVSVTPLSDYGREASGDPAFGISFSDVVTVLNAWNAAAPVGGATLRLPTAAEWQYACQAGTSFSHYSWGDSSPQTSAASYARVRETREATTGATETVASGRKANAYGVFDMHGNLWEWSAVNLSDTTPELHGGSWSDSLLSARLDNRRTFADVDAGAIIGTVGLRLVLEVP